MKTTDEIMALADASATEMIHGHYHPFKEKREALRQAIEALAKDAARYQWLRDFNTDALIFLPNIEPAFGNDVAGVALDTEIDKAIEAAQAEQT